MGPNMGATDDEQRVIPRPSQRRSAVHTTAKHRAGTRRPGYRTTVEGTVRTPDGLVIIPDRPNNTAVSRGRTWPIPTLKAIGAVGGLGGGLAFGVLGFLEREDTLLGLIVAPVLTLIVALSARRFVLPRTNEFVAAAVLAGFGARVVGAVPRLISGADSPVYQLEGVRIANALRAFDFGVDTGRAIPGTGSVRYLAGVVNVVTNSDYVSTFLVFVLFGFIGQVFFLIAIQPVLNDAQMRIATLLIMFSPTMAYWPSSIGKESLALLGIGLSLYGASLVYERNWSGVMSVLAGVSIVGLIRPHVAMLVLAGLVFGLFARQTENRNRFVMHVVVLMVVLVGAMLMTGASAQLFNLESFDGVSDVSAALDFAQNRTSQDNSAFTAARVGSVRDYPWAAVTVLFRPFVWEAANAPSMISGIEGAILAGLLARAVPGLIREIRTIFQRGQLLYAVGFTSVFIFLFSAIGNFGILSRQRAQVIPFVLLLIAFGLGTERLGARRAARR